MGLININNLRAFYNKIKDVFIMRINLDTTGSSTSTTQAVSASAVNTFLNTEAINMVYPVGSIYMSVNNVNPSTFLGGTWETWGSGRIPVGVKATDSNFNTVEKTGGSKTVVVEHTHNTDSHKHTIPDHNHTMNSHTHTYNAHSHAGTSYVAAVGAADDDVMTLAINHQTPTNTSVSGTYSFGHNGQKWSLTKWNHGTKCYGTTATTSLTTNSTTATCNSASMTCQTNTAEINTTSIEIPIVQPYITCYMWKRTA